MGYIYLLLISVVFSFGGTLVKTASVMVASTIISFMRFFVGVVFLVLFLLLRRQKIRLQFCWPVFVGAACKCLNYMTENYCLEKGFSFKKKKRAQNFFKKVCPQTPFQKLLNWETGQRMCRPGTRVCIFVCGD